MASAENEELGSRMARLEAENRGMQAELVAMRAETAEPARRQRHSRGHDRRWRTTTRRER